MFCGKCGAPIQPTDAFCLKCGAENTLKQAVPVQNFQPAPAPAPYPNQAPASPVQPPMAAPVNAAPAPAAPYPGYFQEPAQPAAPKDKKKLFAILGAAALALLLVIIIIARSTGPKAVVRRAMRGFDHGNANKIIKCIPKEVQKEERIDIDEVEEYLEELQEDWEDEFGDNYKFNYKILDTRTADREELEEVREDLEYYYDLNPSKITKAKTVIVLTSFDGSEDYDYDVLYIDVFKYNGKWYTMDMF